MQAHDILHFWFEELTPAQHFAQSDALDAQIRTRFGATWQAAQQCELWAWRATAHGRLAEVVAALRTVLPAHALLWQAEALQPALKMGWTCSE